ncbi:SGNH/GDSL hydrolase family protein [Hymenobacter sp. B81]|uniref:SGNH/GDSL hydrolase family protein n=1 Tax=Hymenobacter sp. B81 TaxID=3344878 RepID=UPI0037DC26E3
MKILFIGDSLIRGTVGVSFVRQLARRHPHWQIENAGVNGEPLLSIARRLHQRLRAGAAYDAVVFEAGANDLLLPTFPARGFWWRQAWQQLRRQGYQPLPDEVDFARHYRETVASLRRHSSAQVVLLTLGCLGEQLATPLNGQRNRYNDIIRRTGAELNCAVADAGAAFDQELAQLPPGRDYLMNSFFNTAWADRVQCFFGRADALSRQRGLHLTIDGGHLNSRGAALFATAVEAHLLALAPLQLA